MKQHLKKWAFRVVNLAVVVAALGYIVWRVDWNNTVTLANGKTKVVAVAQRPNQAGEPGIVIQTDGREEWRPIREFSRPPARTDGTELPYVVPGLKQIMKGVDWKYVWLALAVFSCNYVFLAWRLRLLLKTQDVNLRRRDAVKVSYASAFLNFAVPTGTTGGDVYKAYYVSAHATGRKTEAITIVLLDRVIGLINFIFMAAIVSALSYISGRVGAMGGFIATAFVVSIIVSCLYFSQRVRRVMRVDEWLPKWVIRFRIFKWKLAFNVGPLLHRIDQTAYSLKKHPFLLANCFLWTIVVQTIVCIAAMFFANAVGMNCDRNYYHILDYFLAIIVGLTVSSLPGNPPQGFGVLEGIMASVLVTQRHYGDFNHVFAVCMGIRLLHMIWALPGAIVLLIEPKPKAPVESEQTPMAEALNA